MKIFTGILSLLLVVVLSWDPAMAQQQIQFQGLVSEGEGTAGWNADGSGPEPAATGHQIPASGFGNQYYYGTSHDYITQDPLHAAFHFSAGMQGFPLFEQALSDLGYTADQVKVKYSLVTLGDDVEGLDWFFMDNWAYSNYYDNSFTFFLDGELMLSGYCNYAQMYINTQSGNWKTESAYTQLTDNSQLSSPGVQQVTRALLNDINGAEIIFKYESTYGSSFSGNGRIGAFYNIINGSISVGNPTFPFQGLLADHEGFAGWDADGTGPEPYGDGHLTQLYYGASIDYDGIDPDPSACLGHFLEGETGFFNTMLQLQYRGFEPGDLKLKLGLHSLGPDVEGEDWGYQNGHHWCNYYNMGVVLELNGEPILAIMQDTNTLLSMGTYWTNTTSIGKLYDISLFASTAAQFVAKSLIKDVGTHYLKTGTANIQYHSLFNGNGRDGALYEILEGALQGVHRKATFVPAGALSGVWTTENSPYFIDGHQSIENGQTLTIEPGVDVKIRGPYHFDVQGRVLAEGTPEEPILFTRSNPNIWWDGFDFNNTPPENDSTKIDHCVFEYGYAQGTATKFNSGGAVAILNFQNIGIYNSVFRHNKADIPGYYPPSGGAIAFEQCDLTIQKCTFFDNFSEYGGAIFVYSQTNPVISNNLFYKNESWNGGALCYYEYCNGTLINNTFSENTAIRGGALYFYLNSHPEVINSIFWGDSATYGNEVYLASSGGHPGFYYCNLQGGIDGFGGYSTFHGDYINNLDADPLFSGDELFPYSIANENSPCWNAGTPDTSAWYYPGYLPATCLCGADRIADGCIDIGAYEYALGTGVSPIPEPVTDAAMVSPNPFIESFRVDFQLRNSTSVRIELFDLLGRVHSVFAEKGMPAGIYKKTVDAAGLPDGVYFCRVQTGNESITIKIIKTR